MREHLFATVDLSQQAGRPLSCTYHILIKDITEPIQCERYGVRITVDQTGERKELPDITVLPDAVLKLVQQLAESGVTPCTLRSVVEDWLI